MTFNLGDRIRFKSEIGEGTDYEDQEADVICLPLGGASSTSTAYSIKFDDGMEVVAWEQELTLVRAASQ